MSMHTIRCVCVGEGVCVWMGGWLQHITALQHTASHGKSLEHTLQHYTTHYNIAPHCNTQQLTATHTTLWNTLQQTVVHCNTHYNTLHVYLPAPPLVRWYWPSALQTYA